MSMASHQQQQPYPQKQQRHDPSNRGNSNGSTNANGSHYTTQQQQRHYDDLTPQSSFSSTSSHQNHSPTPSRGNSGSNGINISDKGSASPRQHYSQPKKIQLNYLSAAPFLSTSPSQAPPSPISPSNTSPVETLSSHLNLTRLDDPVQDRVSIEFYDQKQYQQPRKKSLSSAHQQQENYGLKQSGSSGSARSVGSQGRYVNGELKQSGSSGSTRSTSSSRNHPVDSSPSSPSPLSYDHDHNDNNDHQQQALQYQRKLQQKPPSTHGDDDSDDSDSGSMLSYRRSISRLSMTYKRNNAPNISLFAPNQRPAMLQSHHGGHSSELTSSQKMIQDQREERLRQQKMQQGHNSNNSMASIDQHTRQDEGRPMMARNVSQNHYPGGPQIPERSTSSDSYNNGSSGASRSRQQQYPGGTGNGGRSNPSSPSMANRQLANQHSQQPPRPSHESARSQHSQRSRPDRLNLSPDDYQQNESAGSRSRSPAPMGGSSPARSPGSPLPGSSGSGGGGGNYRQNGPGGFNSSSASLPLPSPRGPPSGGPGMNPHPAHHLASGGYVRPEEAVGPSNPMPEKAEDFVRQGIEYHEVGDIDKATTFFRTAAELGDPVGMLMYGLSVRHGWGCASNRQLAFQYLQKSAEHAVGDLKSRDSFASTAAKGELVLAIYELGICFRHGWGVGKNKKTAAYYFEIAANLGDPDAQNDLAWCYYHGVGVKKDMFKAAKYYRLAAAQGLETVGNSWIWKDKYGGMPTSPTVE
ncbi:hypothetical protein BG011_001631 [Mortierella polycephala]|uniref:HCP-like protein n=1 Tax=Mortierella polycephala TaxID=41804 RepID=A0A9P6Q538_9FUNG|nr:hypothetical protein BG011_001631 [Mortierella polycephala]